jgi:hypothetical protein
LKCAYISTIIASPTRKIRFRIFPTPKSLNSKNKVITKEVSKPLLELIKIKEKRKNRKAKRLIKNKNINKGDGGVVK